MAEEVVYDTHRESDILELDAVTRLSTLTAPILVNVQPVCCVPCYEVLQLHVLHSTATSVGLDHEDLVTAVRVDVTIEDILDTGVGTERTNGRASRLIAPDLLDLDVIGG